MPQRTICKGCGHIFYEGPELSPPDEILKKYEHCPNCGRKLNFIPDVKVKPAEPEYSARTPIKRRSTRRRKRLSYTEKKVLSYHSDLMPEEESNYFADGELEDFYEEGKELLGIIRNSDLDSASKDELTKLIQSDIEYCERKLKESDSTP